MKKVLRIKKQLGWQLVSVDSSQRITCQNQTAWLYIVRTEKGSFAIINHHHRSYILNIDESVEDDLHDDMPTRLPAA